MPEKSMINPEADKAAGSEASAQPEEHSPEGATDQATPVVATDAAARSAELRANLSSRQQAEDFLAEASETRRRATVEAAGLLDEAQQLAEQMTTESTASADTQLSEARERATGIVAEAKDEATRRIAEAQVEADRIRSESQEQAHVEQARLRAEALAEIQREYDDLRATLSKLSTLSHSSFGALTEALGRAQEVADDLSAAIGPSDGALDSAAGGSSSVPDPENHSGPVTLPAPPVIVNRINGGAPIPAMAAVVPPLDEVLQHDDGADDGHDDGDDDGDETYDVPSQISASAEIVDTAGAEETHLVEESPAGLLSGSAESESGTVLDNESSEARPLGWLFRSAQS